ncbi:MAG TPA: hypothetical protein GXX38_06800 [Clostridia bacterium]|jgi:acyl-coenzyme A thioesterase PaaI-like protein|nr:hypothetical protein [Clostridia bacterium]
MTRISQEREYVLAAQLVEGKIGNEEIGCLKLIKPKFINYTPGESLTYFCPVLHSYLNDRKIMQGGFISAAFDNALEACDKRGKFVATATTNMMVLR